MNEDLRMISDMHVSLADTRDSVIDGTISLERTIDRTLRQLKIHLQKVES